MSDVFTSEEYKEGEENGINRNDMRKRYSMGWSKERCYTQPIKRQKKGKRRIGGQVITQEKVEIAESNGVNTTNLHNRLSTGWPVDKAINTPLTRTRPQRNKNNDHEYFTPDYLSECIARIKGLNKQLPERPMAIPQPMLDKADKYGIDYKNIEPQEVGDIDL